jgi:hypothetical protein
MLFAAKSRQSPAVHACGRSIAVPPPILEPQVTIGLKTLLTVAYKPEADEVLVHGHLPSGTGGFDGPSPVCPNVEEPYASLFVLLQILDAKLCDLIKTGTGKNADEAETSTRPLRGHPAA